MSGVQVICVTFGITSLNAEIISSPHGTTAKNHGVNQTRQRLERIKDSYFPYQLQPDHTP